MRELNVNLGLLAEAMDDADLNRMYFSHLETGQLLSGLSGPQESAEDMELLERVDGEPDTYQQVGRTRPERTYLDMDDFVRILADKSVAAALLRAIRSRRALEEFAQVLAETPSAENQWVAFRAGKGRDRAARWLKSVGVEPV